MLTPENFSMGQQKYDVVIVGGSIAGLSAAMTLARAVRTVLVIDCGTPCNLPAPRSHNFITNDGRKPSEILLIAKSEIGKYENINFFDDKVADVRQTADGFEVVTESREIYQGSKILLCTGLTDVPPDIPGFAACWGISILHCPYCHGYEVRNETTGILANGEAAYHLGILINNWTDDLTILTNGVSELRNEELEKLTNRNIKVVEYEIDKFIHNDGQLRIVQFADGSFFSAKAIYASIPYRQQSDLAEKLGCKMSSHGHIDVDDEQRTSIPGVYAAGDNTAQQRAVSVASASGTKAGFTINLDLILK